MGGGASLRCLLSFDNFLDVLSEVFVLMILLSVPRNASIFFPFLCIKFLPYGMQFQTSRLHLLYGVRDFYENISSLDSLFEKELQAHEPFLSITWLFDIFFQENLSP